MNHKGYHIAGQIFTLNIGEELPNGAGLIGWAKSPKDHWEVLEGFASDKVYYSGDYFKDGKYTGPTEDQLEPRFFIAG